MILEEVVSMPYKDPEKQREYQRYWQIKYRIDRRDERERERLGLPPFREAHPELYAYIWPGRARREGILPSTRREDVELERRKRSSRGRACRNPVRRKPTPYKGA